MSSTTPSSSSVALGYYGRVIRLRIRWILGSVALALIAAITFLLAAPSAVTASSVVKIEVISTDPFSLDRAASGFLDPSTETQLAQSYVTAELAAEVLPLEPNDIRRSISVIAQPDGTIVTVNYTAPTRSEAAEGADAVAEAYLNIRQRQAEARAEHRIGAIDVRLEDLNGELSNALERLSAAEPGSLEAATAESDRQFVRVEVDRLISERASLQNLSSSAGQIITAARYSTPSYQPSRTIVLGGGVTLGLLTGLVLAFARHRSDPRIPDTADVAELTHSMVLQGDRAEDGTIRYSAAAQVLVDRATGLTRIAVVGDAPADRARQFADELCAAVHSAGRVCRVEVDDGPEHNHAITSNQTTPDPGDSDSGEGETTLVATDDAGPLTLRLAEISPVDARHLATIRECQQVLLLVEIGASDRAVTSRLVEHIDDMGRPIVAALALSPLGQAARDAASTSTAGT